MNPLAKLRTWLHGVSTAAPRPQTNGASPAPLFRVIAPEARDRWQGAALRSYTPQYVEQITRGAMAGHLQAQWEMFDLMEQTWPRLNSALNDLKDAVLGLQWNLQPWSRQGASPSPEAQRRARLCEELLWNFEPQADHDENDFEDTLRDVLDSVGKGVAVLEIDWHVKLTEAGAALAPRCTRWVHPRFYGYPIGGVDRLMLDTTQLASNRSYVQNSTFNVERSTLNAERRMLNGSTLQLFNASTLQPTQDQFAPFPSDKFLISICKQKSGHPISGALLRILGFWWAASNFTWEWFLRYAQIFGMPFRMAFYDANASQATIDKIQQMLEGMGSAAWAAFPAGTQFEIKTDLQHASRSAHQALLDAADKLVDILIKRQTLTTDAGDRGTQALGVVHQGVRADRIMAVAGHAARIINRQLLPAICRLNFGEARECPWIQPSEKEAKNEKAMAERDRTLLEAGLPMPRTWLYERHAIPQPAEGEEVLVAPSQFRVPGSGFRVPSSELADGVSVLASCKPELERAGSSAASPHPNNSEPRTRNSEPRQRTRSTHS
jgi:phage gp29-like protein